MTRKNPDAPLVQRDPFDPFRMMTEMLGHGPFEAWFQQHPSVMPQGVLAPAFDVKERADAYVIEADLPGMSEDDIVVTLTNNRLTVGGQRQAQREQKNEHMHTVERQYGSFSRSFTLPADAEADSIQADLSDGVLSLIIPKSEKSKAKKISIGSRIKKALKS